MENLRIAGIIPAAGKSKRMTVDKRLLEISGMTLLEASTKTLVNAGCFPVIVVISKDFPFQNLKYLNSKNQIIIATLPYESESMISTIVYGLNFLPDSVDGIAVLPGDCSVIPSSTVQFLNKTFHSEHPDLLMPVYDKQQGHPRYISKKMFSSLCNINKVNGSKFSDLFLKNKSKVLKVNVDDSSIIVDVDTLSEYNYILKKYAKK